MMRITRMLYVAWIAILPFTLTPVTIAHAQAPTVTEMTSSGLLTFSERDRAIRVAIVFAEADDAVVETIVRFVDVRGNVLRARRGNLSDRAPFIVELTRSDVGGHPDVLVRVEVFHKLPGMREVGYPILISVQPISEDGSGRFLLGWNGGGCGAEPGTAAAPPQPTPGPAWADCTSTFPVLLRDQ